MMTDFERDAHPITPSPDLIRKWNEEAATAAMADQRYIAIQAANWGADMELEACCAWLKAKLWIYPEFSDELRAARRPKLKSLAEEALEEVGTFEGMGTCNIDIIRRALERLQELEGQGDG